MISITYITLQKSTAIQNNITLITTKLQKRLKIQKNLFRQEKHLAIQKEKKQGWKI